MVMRNIVVVRSSRGISHCTSLERCAITILPYIQSPHINARAISGVHTRSGHPCT